MAERQEWDTSRTLHERTVTLLYVIFITGGHVSWENPPGSIATSEPFVLNFFDKIVANMIFLPGCKWLVPWAKSWLLASSFSGFRPLGGVCPHGKGAHPSLRGKRDRKGHFISRQTARFPDALALDYASAALPLFSDRADSEVSFAAALVGKPVSADTLPPKLLRSPGPVQMFCNDGTGLGGTGDWRFPPPGAHDRLGLLRKNLLEKAVALAVPHRLAAHAALASESNFFSDSEILEIRAIFLIFVKSLVSLEILLSHLVNHSR